MSVEDTEIKLEYVKMLEDKVKALRNEACEVAEKARQIKKKITSEDIEELESWKQTVKAWS